MARDAEQLKKVLARCAIGATRFEEKFSHEQLARMVKRDLKARFKKDSTYSAHIRDNVPGLNVKAYGARRRTSSEGTFFKSTPYEVGGGLATLLTGGWTRVAKDRIDFAAWSHQFGAPRKSERQSWRLHFIITERDGRRSPCELPREKLAGNGASALKLLMRAGVHVIAQKPLVDFLRFKPKREIVRMPQVGFFEVDGYHIYVRSNETLLPPALRESKNLVYEADTAHDPDQYGHQIKGTTADWQSAVAIPLRGNSNVALTLATSFASALLAVADEQRGGVHLFGLTGIGKTAILAVGESVYGLPGASGHPRAFGRTWAVTPTGLEDLLRMRNHAGFFLDELQRVPRENRGGVVQMIYAFTQVQKARGGSWRLQGDGAGQVFLLSSGEDPIATFVGKGEDREGRERRMPDIPAEVQNGSAFETIDREALREKLPGLYEAMIKQCHGAPGRDWQMWLVELGAVKVRARIDRERLAFLALPQVRDIVSRAQAQLRPIVRRFALYAASLRMAIEANVLPWTVAEADAGLIACLERWVRQRGNTNPVTTLSRFVAELMRKLADDLSDCFIRLHKVKGRFVPATDSDMAKQQTSPEAYDGYIKDDLVLIRPVAWARRCAGTDPAEIARYLHARDILLASEKDGKFSKTVQAIGRSERFYVIRRTALVPPDTSDTSDP
jgi:putative DNA primase/helicase